MENEDKQSEPLLCPFCGAPQRGYIPADTLQVKCRYCGGVFLTKPSVEGEVYRCVNHPMKLAIGTCNDCAQSFCGDCLHYYVLETEYDRISLYLCPDCLRRRHASKADDAFLIGLVFVLLAVVLSIMALPVSLVFGLLVGAIGAGIMIYGNYKRSQPPDESTISELRQEKQRRREEVAARGGIDAEELYSELMTQYATRYGASSGIQILQEEIQAYTRHGESFETAVEKIYRRQKKRR